MKYRVIQWATGGVGRAAIQGIVNHPELELVGCWVHSRAKDGRDAGELAGHRAARRRRDARRRRAARARRGLRPLQPDPRRCGSSSSASCARGRTSSRRSAGSFRGERRTSRRSRRPATPAVSRCTAPASTPAASPSASRSWSRRSRAASRTSARRSSPTSAPTTRPTSSATSCCSARRRRRRRRARWSQFLATGFFQSIDMVAAELGVALDPEKTHATRDRGRHPADRLADRPDPAGTRRGAALHLGGDGRRRAVHDRAHQLVHGPGAPRSAVDVRTRGRALRGRGPGRSAGEADASTACIRPRSPRA